MQPSPSQVPTGTLLLTPTRSPELGAMDAGSNPGVDGAQVKEQQGLEPQAKALLASMSGPRPEVEAEQHADSALAAVSQNHDEDMASHAKQHLARPSQHRVPIPDLREMAAPQMPSRSPEYDHLIRGAQHAPSVNNGREISIDENGNMKFSLRSQQDSRQDSHKNYQTMLTERFGKEIVGYLNDTLLKDPDIKLTPKLLQKVDRFAASIEDTGGSQHSQRDFINLSKDPDFQELLKQEKKWKAADSKGAYVKGKVGDAAQATAQAAKSATGIGQGLGPKGVLKQSASSAGVGLLKMIPGIGHAIKFLGEKSTGDAIRLNTLFTREQGPNKFANEVLGSLAGRAEDKQVALGASAAVGSVLTAPGSIIPGVHVAGGAVANVALNGTWHTAANSASKTMVSQGATAAAQQGGTEYADEGLKSRRIALNNGETTKMSHQSSVYALMQHLSTPLRSEEEIAALAGTDAKKNEDLHSAREAKSKLITELGGDPKLHDGSKLRDANTDYQLLRLMSKPEPGFQSAMTMLIRIANSGQAPSAAEVQRFEHMTSSDGKKGQDLTALLASSQVKTEKGFNYHNAAILATRIAEHPTFDYEMYTGNSIGAGRKESGDVPQLQSQDELRRGAAADAPGGR